ncbi:RIP metalloprotease RseP [Colwellia sp. 39_35_sub15_T18]|nr:RIP metalloprotease RseP [Colwellia sp. 39_35_sub15_T18]
MFDFIWNAASFVIALGILVTVHEYGHFWVARKNGVKVERFSVGFGKAIWRKTGLDGTEYVVAMIPLGGYVKMLDERVDDVSEQDKDKTFNSKSVYQRIAIIAAGPFANFAFAIFAFYLMFLIGVPSIKPIIADVIPNSILAQAQVADNVEIIEVAGKRVRDWQDVNLALVGEIGSDSILLKTKTADSQFISSHTLDTKNWQFSPEKTSALTSLGITPFRPKVHNEIARVSADSPAQRAGLQVGDTLVALNDDVLAPGWLDFSQKIKNFPEQEVMLTIERSGKPLTLTIIPEGIESEGELVGYLGVSPKADEWPSEYKIELSYDLFTAMEESVVRTWNLVTLSFDMIGKLITGDVSVKNLSGPIAIAQGAGDSAGYGFVYFLGFLALISINLGIINLLPLPVLDGGHLLYYVIELLTGKPVPEKIQEVGFKFGALALLALMSIALFNDFSRVLG